MQLNIYVPKDKERIVRKLDVVARQRRRKKNDLILAALDRYLAECEPPELESFDMGEMKVPSRRELYEEILEHRVRM